MPSDAEPTQADEQQLVPPQRRVAIAVSDQRDWGGSQSNKQSFDGRQAKEGPWQRLLPPLADFAERTWLHHGSLALAHLQLEGLDTSFQ